MTSKIVSSIGFNISEKIENTAVQVLSAFSQGLFVNYIYAFELIALILTIIVVGITLFDKKEDK
jgi:NADH:ubiquinone oxidoreductase subunit 6 (subunit J)